MTRVSDEVAKKKEADRLIEPVEHARDLADRLGLEPYDVKYWVVDYDDINQLAAYGGFQERFPHWRWGMMYDQQKKQSQYLGGKIYEMVINDNPSHAYLQESNDLADQKAVITHVEAHSDFFAKNKWYKMFADDPDAAALLSRHADDIRDYMNDPDVDRGEVERWIDNILCIEDNIDQHKAYKKMNRMMQAAEKKAETREELEERLGNMGFSDIVRDQTFDDEWYEEQLEADDANGRLPETDLLKFLRDHGKSYDAENDRAVEVEDWQRDVISMLREESYYFAPQKMTKVMNEGWAAYWESMMMGEEMFATEDEFLKYANHQAGVLNSPGLNPYKLGKEMWEYIENETNREEVAAQLLRTTVETETGPVAVTPANFHDVVDFDAVYDALEPDEAINEIREDTLDRLEDVDSEKVDADNLEKAREGDIDIDSFPWKVLTYEGLAERHYSLTKPQNRGFLQDIDRSTLEDIDRYLDGAERYDGVEEAMDRVDRTKGWDTMREIRADHNDITFIDAFLTQEFVDNNKYYVYENLAGSMGVLPVVSSTEAEDVKKKLLHQFTNFGKPQVFVEDDNYDNQSELLLAHNYNGVEMDLGQAMNVLERLHNMWGRPVHLKTITKVRDEDYQQQVDRAIEEIVFAHMEGRDPHIELPRPDEEGFLLSYDGEEVSGEELDWEEVQDIAADDIDYDTTPEEWIL